MHRPSRPAMLVAALVLASACSSEGGLMAVPTTPPPNAASSSDISFSVTGATVESVRLPPPPFPGDVKAAVSTTLDRYLQAAVLGPLRSGLPAGDLGPVFTGPARARVDGPDRPALVDENVLATGDLKAETATVGLAGLADADGAMTVVTAAFDLRLRTDDDDPLTITRAGHLVLVRDGDGWKIDGYDVRTTREGGEGATTTTARG